MISTALLVMIYLSFISLGLPDSVLGSAWPSWTSGWSWQERCTVCRSLISGRVRTCYPAVRRVRGCSCCCAA